MQTLKIKAPLLCKLIKNCKDKTKHTNQGIVHLLILYNSKKITPNTAHQPVFCNSKKNKNKLKLNTNQRTPAIDLQSKKIKIEMHTNQCSAS